MTASSLRSGLAAVVLASVFAPLAALPARAASFDGNWSVLILTDAGTCDRAYRYPIKISGGVLSLGDQSGFDVSGKVAGSGAVSVHVARGSQEANGTGSLSAKDGSGTWKGGACSGTWRAEKRG